MSAFDPKQTFPTLDPDHFQAAGLNRYDAVEALFAIVGE
jgi:hypothetical protein